MSGYSLSENITLALLIGFILLALLLFGLGGGSPEPDAAIMERRLDLIEERAADAVRRIEGLEARATSVTMIAPKIYLSPDMREAIVVR